jgi:hypothetical protein
MRKVQSTKSAHRAYVWRVEATYGLRVDSGTIMADSVTTNFYQ